MSFFAAGLSGTHDGPMTLTDDARKAVTRRVLDGDAPGPVYALVGLIDRVATDSAQARSLFGGGVGSAVSGLVSVPKVVWDAATSEYSALVQRGEERSVEIAAERAVRKRVTRFEDQIAPRAARTTVRVNERRKQWAASRARRHALRARQQARAAARRFGELNAPVLEDEPLP